MSKKKPTKPARTARRKRVPMPEPFRVSKDGYIIARCYEPYGGSVLMWASCPHFADAAFVRRYSAWLLRAAAWMEDAR